MKEIPWDIYGEIEIVLSGIEVGILTFQMVGIVDKRQAKGITSGRVGDSEGGKFVEVVGILEASGDTHYLLSMCLRDCVLWPEVCWCDLGLVREDVWRIEGR